MMWSGLSPAQQEAILREIGRRCSDALRPNWSRAAFTWAAPVSGDSTALSVVDEAGNTRAEGIPDGVVKLCGRLRTGMHRPGTGTWSTMTYELSADGSHMADFDYDVEPETGGFAPGDHAEKIARVPCDPPQHVPDRLSETLDRVPNVYIGIHAEPGARYGDGNAPRTDEVAWAFAKEGWDAGHGEYGGEFAFTTDWATLQTLTDHGVMQLSGNILPDRWDDLIALLTRQGWRFSAALYNGDVIIRQISLRVEPPATASRNVRRVDNVA